ncbi:MAG: malonyl-ACP O-methyltransferase BioC [Candidatus Saganbacteria bacterium]|nr:malonyl-ACP O-methyltransferase BioC [Candidatus Saganbacteria bacterium]
MLDKNLIGKNFSASAAGYDQHAQMQKTMADRLFEILLNYELQLNTVLDIGCGTGYLTRKLAERFPHARIEGIDIAPGMIAIAEKIKLDNLVFMVGDGENLTGQDYDLVVANAALQWMSLERTFDRVACLLRPDGHFLFTTFGPRTLIELKESGFNVNEFPRTNEIEQLLKAEFDTVFLATEVEPQHFPSVKDLVYYLIRLGAQTSSQEKLFRPEAFRHYKERYSDGRGGVSASFELIYGVFRRRG